MRIFREFSPMSPERNQPGEMSMEEFIIYMENDLQWREQRIAQLECSTQKEMQKLEVILQAKDRSASRSRKRKIEDCKSCKEDFKNSCLDCKEQFSSKKLKINHDEIAVHKNEIEKIKEEFKTRQATRQAQIAAEAQQKEAEAQAQNGRVKEENQSDEDYPTSSNASSQTSSNEDVKEEADVKVEPEEPNAVSIGMFNQVKSEPMSPTNASPQESDSSSSSSDDDMDEEQVNQHPVYYRPVDNQAPFMLPPADRLRLERQYGTQFNDDELFQLFLDEF